MPLHGFLVTGGEFTEAAAVPGIRVLPVHVTAEYVHCLERSIAYRADKLFGR